MRRTQPRWHVPMLAWLAVAGVLLALVAVLALRVWRGTTLAAAGWGPSSANSSAACTGR